MFVCRRCATATGQQRSLRSSRGQSWSPVAGKIGSNPFGGWSRAAAGGWVPRGNRGVLVGWRPGAARVFSRRAGGGDRPGCQVAEGLCLGQNMAGYPVPTVLTDSGAPATSQTSPLLLRVLHLHRELRTACLPLWTCLKGFCPLSEYY